VNKMQELQERVERGVALLDAHYPGWRDKIWADGLEMDTCSNCVLGQLYDCSFINGLRTLEINSGYAWCYGFDLADEEKQDDMLWSTLETIWKYAIEGDLARW
jgi:hypothetical protein